ncbi:MAG: hypothetical protein H7Y09_06025, partial [Chitinophagaceae bacterium]|nr:hypothetical protein [Anaerolineae bacterium]
MMRLLVLGLLMLVLVAFVLMQRRAVVETAAAGFPVLPFVEQSGDTMPTAYRADLPDRGLAPELSNTAWLNTERPLRLADLRGQVVLLEFWPRSYQRASLASIPPVYSVVAALPGTTLIPIPLGIRDGFQQTGVVLPE